MTGRKAMEDGTSRRDFELLRCPDCLGELAIEYDEAPEGKTALKEVRCNACGEEYECSEGIPRFFSSPDDQETPTGLSDEDMRDKVRQANVELHDRTADTYEHDLTTEYIYTKHCQQRIEKAIRHLAETTGGDSLVDVACGTGNVLNYSRKHFQRILGVDISLGMLRIASDRGYSVVQGDAYRLPVAANSVSAVTGFSMLHHLYDYEAFFAECLRVLQPGGMIYIDYEPNGAAKKIVDRSLFGRSFRILYGKVRYLRGLLSRSKTTMHHVHGSISDLAEFYQRDGGGFFQEDLQDKLHAIGFSDIVFLKHWNSGGITAKERKSVSIRDRIMQMAKPAAALHFSVEDLSPFLLIFAQKPKAGSNSA